MRQSKRRRLGFTLVELAIVLAVLGLLSTMGMQAVSIMSEQKKAADTKKKLDDIELALISYFNLYGRLPCPAARNTPEDSADFGKETLACNAAITTEDLDDISVGASGSVNGVRIGVAPVVDLGLPKTHMFDGWGNRITYAAIQALATSGSYSGLVNDDGDGGVTTGIINIKDRTGNQLSLASDLAIIPYVLASHGKDGKGAYNSAGNLSSIACSGTNDDVENCDYDDVIFVADTQFDVAGNADYYDDYVRYKTKDLFESEAELLKPTISSGGTAAADDPDDSIQFNSGSNTFAGNAGFIFTTSAGLVGNEGSNLPNLDFRWETDNLEYGLFVDNSSDKVSIGMNTATQSTSTLTVPSIELTPDGSAISSTEYLRLDGESTGGMLNLRNGTYDTLSISPDSFTMSDTYAYETGGSPNFVFTKTSTITPEKIRVGAAANPTSVYSGVSINIPQYSNAYINFGNFDDEGEDGYGFRNANDGSIQFKDDPSGINNWTNIRSGTVLATNYLSVATGNLYETISIPVDGIITLNCTGHATGSGAPAQKIADIYTYVNSVAYTYDRGYYYLPAGGAGGNPISSTSVTVPVSAGNVTPQCYLALANAVATLVKMSYVIVAE